MVSPSDPQSVGWSVGRQQLLIILVGKAICYVKEATNLKGKNWEIRYDFVKTIGPS